MKKRIVVAVMCVLVALLSLAIITACMDNSGKNDTIDNSSAKLDFETVYAYAKDAGYTGTMEELAELFKGDNAYQIAVNNGYSGTESEWLQTLIGASGKDGKDGITPNIGENGNWWIGETDTGVKAQGEKGDKGDAGNGIEKIELTSRTCTEDIYTVFYTDGTTGELKVNNNGSGHIYEEENVQIVQSATCTGYGIIFNYCTVCGHIEPKTVSALGHKYENGVCSRCGELEAIEPTIGLEYELNEDGESYSVTGIGTATDTDIVIALTYNGKPVTSIGSYAFYGCRGLTSITVGDSVRYMGYEVFIGCDNLKSVYYTGDIASWCTISFQGDWYSPTSNPLLYAHNLYINNELVTEIEIPNTVTEIKNNAFAGWSGTGIIISDSVTRIGVNAFHQCDNLQYYEYDNGYYLGNDNNKYLCLVKAKSKDIMTCTINSDTKFIHSGAFRDCKNLTKITIPDNVMSIGYQAFTGCNSLTNITIGKSVTSIGEMAFNGCYKLVEVYNKSSLNIEKGSSDQGYVGDYAKAIYTEPYESRLSMDENGYIIYTDGEEKTIIGYTGNGTELSLPTGITDINKNAFRDCNSLTSITIPASVKSIGDDAFYDCYSLTSINYVGTVSEWQNISKVGNWDYNTGNYTAYCTDGIVAKDGTISRDEEVTGTEGLKYTLSNDGTSYSVTGIGTATDTNVVIASTYNGKPVTSIGERAFLLRTGLTSVTIGNNVTSIGRSAFLGCLRLTSIVVSTGNTVYHSNGSCLIETASKTLLVGCQTSIIPADDTVTSIGEGAFAYCRGLTSITIPDSVTSIEDYAFYYCTGLTSITIPDSVMSIGSEAFSDCSSLTSVTIPDSVMSIGSEAFSDCASLVYNEYDNAYYLGNENNPYHVFIKAKNKSFTQCEINPNTKIISSSAFDNCASLTNITIPDSVTSIGYYAFAYCSGLTSVTIGNSVRSIGEGAFAGCTGLTSIIVLTGNTVYHSNGNCLIETASKTLIAGCKTSKIPVDDSVTSIGDSAFYDCDDLTSITIPDGVTSIGSSAFRGCDNLTSIVVPDSVTSIGSYAFDSCASLVYNEYDNAYYLGNENNPYLVLIKAKNISITQCEINQNTKVIYVSAFYDCNELTSITIPASVTSIGDDAFYECNKLVEVYNKSSLNIIVGIEDYGYIAYYALNVYTEENGSKLSIDNNGYLIYTDGEEKILVDYTGNETNLTLPGGVTEIYKYAFINCNGLKRVTIPDSVISIGSSAFSHCNGLTSITIPASVTSIGNGAFYECNKLIEVYNKSSLSITVGGTGYGYVAYYALNVYTKENGSKLSIDSNGYLIYTDGEEKILVDYTGNETNLTLLDDITEIYKYAFYDCNGLTSVIIPNTVTSIGEGAFAYCSGLTSITIPDRVTSVGDYAFVGCSGLTSITIPSTLTSIGNYVIMDCICLTTIYYGGTVSQCEEAIRYLDSGLLGIRAGLTLVCTDGEIQING